MREIHFRGICKDSKRWAYGYYVHFEDFSQGINYHGICSGYYNTHFEVIPETVGQYTGLDDKNGKGIFEGDIVKISFGKGFLKAVVKFGYYNQTDKILKSHLGFYFDFVDSESYRKDVGFWTGKTFSKIEIIGNIHDNPELMGGNTHG